jgi:hypothetical protein
LLSGLLSRGRMSDVSMKSVDPPMEVHARPMTTPGGVTSYMRSLVNIGLPTDSCKLSTLTSMCCRFSLTSLNAALRKICKLYVSKNKKINIKKSYGFEKAPFRCVSEDFWHRSLCNKTLLSDWAHRRLLLSVLVWRLNGWLRAAGGIAV